MIAVIAEPILRVAGLSAVFPNGNGGLHVLDQISFDVRESEFVCLLGPSGSGKSTLLRILAGLLDYQEGEVILDGALLHGPRPGVGMVFQKANLMPWRTVRENIFLPLELQGTPEAQAEETIQELIDLVGLTGFEDSLPRDLSGGMAQRVAIARALVHDPDMLLLDEPFGALDALTRERMAGELLRIWNARCKTVFMVTHDIGEAIFLSDRVLAFSERPARLTLDLEVDLPRPRSLEMRYTPEFGRMAMALRHAIGR
ncbi:MAG: ABC transporter ATP-binding protein [Anaerolineales bacterium]